MCLVEELGPTTTTYTQSQLDGGWQVFLLFVYSGRSSWEHVLQPLTWQYVRKMNRRGRVLLEDAVLITFLFLEILGSSVPLETEIH